MPQPRAPRIHPDGLLRRGSALTVPLVLALGLAAGTGQVLAGAFGGAVGWAVLRWVIVTRVVAPDFHRGRRAVAADDWAAGRDAYAAAVARWRGRPALDRWRAPLLGTTSRWPYVLLARYNHAVCLASLDRDAEALAEVDALIRDAPRLREARQLQDALRARLGHSGGPPRAVGEGTVSEGTVSEGTVSEGTVSEGEWFGD